MGGSAAHECYMNIYTRTYPKEFCAFGEYHVLSIHQKAINFVNNSGNIFSLHPSIQYMTSFGYVLPQDDYQYLCQSLQQNTISHISKQKIVIGNIQIFIQGRAISTRISKVSNHFATTNLLSPDDMRHSGYQNAIEHNLPLLSIKHYLQQPTEDNAKKILDFIGFGPGLTPSFDDSLVGVLAIIYLSNQTEKYIPLLRPWINYQNLSTRTTVISIKFLSEALEGVFSYPFYRLLKRLFKPNYCDIELARFKRYGHSSGIDTLIGMNITQNTFKEKIL